MSFSGAFSTHLWLLFAAAVSIAVWIELRRDKSPSVPRRRDKP
ncbi:MAG: hypothetical protein V4812_08050 [Pseudomonadota bacterium]